MSTDLELFLAEQGERPVRRAHEGAFFLSQLSYADLQRLRGAVKRVYMKFYPVEFFTDREADKMIESLAPSIAERLIKAAVDNKLSLNDGRLNHGYLRLDE